MGVVTTRAPNGLGSQNPAKKFAHLVDLLGQPLTRNQIFQIFKDEPPSRQMNLFAEYTYFFI